MCGRFNILTGASVLRKTFGIIEDNCSLSDYEPSFNVSPSPKNTPINSQSMPDLTRIPIVRISSESDRMLQLAIWPLIPTWASNCVPNYSTANARAETAAAKPSFRNVWRRSQRCLIPADGFYEWQNVEFQKNKQPWHIRHKKYSIMSFAGIWEAGQTDQGESFISCAVMTAPANALMRRIHNSNHRMPVIIDPENYDQWLCGNQAAAAALAVTYEDGRLAAIPVSEKINNPKYAGSDCIDPLESALLADWQEAAVTQENYLNLSVRLLDS